MKVFGLFLGALVALSLAGCGDGSGGSGGSGGSTSTGGGGTGGATGGTGGATGGTGGATGGTGGAPGLSCDAYCTEIMANCTGDVQQYSTADICKAVCAKFDPGTAADMAGATLGCRTYHGGAPAVTDAATHCPHAGPLGDGVCGDDCANFCDLAMAICGDQASPPYASTDECMTACQSFPDTAAIPYNAGVNSGDSLACRMYHLTAASTDAATHCAHIAAVSPVCK